jgi:two-component system chemotaxis sensor kinase CheA
MDDLLADFLTETQEGLGMLDAALVRLERAPTDSAILGEVFRVVHTIKGTCGFLGLGRLERVAHAAENVLGRWREGALSVTPAGITLILRAIDSVRSIVTGLEQTGAEPAGDDSALIAVLNAAAAGEVIEATAPGGDAADAHAPAAAPVGAPPPARTEAALPAVPAPRPSAAPSDAPRPAAGPETPAEPVGAAPQTIRVTVEVLEDLMTLVSELVLTRNQLLQLSRHGGDPAFTAPLQRLSQITSELQDGVMKTRMQPIGNAWAKLPRLVRDLGVELGKKIDLVMRGAETELDRQVLELIRDPLTHMVRNSADHGLETPEQRRAGGKPEVGRITLNAFHQGGHIVIEIGDDGRGLNVERIRQKALSQGLATEAELAAMSEREVLRFIFRAGFSTAAEVTAVSGRGVGMDVVKTNMERIGGTIEVSSTQGRGSTFTVKIPLTLAIVSALIVESGGERFAVPQIGVVELVRIGGTAEGASGPRIERIKDAPVLRLRDRLLPLVGLSRLLALGDSAEEEGFVIVSQVGAQLFGLIVDRVFDTEEIVVKPVAPILRHLTLFSGNTILGDGSVIMILDLNGIARTAGLGSEAGEAATTPTDAAPAWAQNETGLGGRTALLLFRAGDATPKAVPLGLVARIETVERERIEIAGGQPLVQYRGRLMPLVPLDPSWCVAAAPAAQPVLVFGEDGRGLGLVVEEILDVVEESLSVDNAGARPGFLGSAVLNGKVTELIDTAWWLAQAGEDWFSKGKGPSRSPGGEGPRVLVVEDSAFFRNLVVPALGAAGYVVTAVPCAEDALRLREAGAMFEAVVSDITMPGMGGIEFARTVRAEGAWRNLPLVALSGNAAPADVDRGRDAGFTDYVAKYDRDALLQSLALCLAPPMATAA